jgi:protein ImuB
MRRLLSLWLPDFACERLARRRTKDRAAPSAAPAEAGGTAPPLALLRAQQGRLLLAAVDAAAAAQGLAPGQPLAAARTLVPELRVCPEAPSADQAALRRLLAWCRRYSPWVALDPASAIGDGAGRDGAGEEAGFGGDAALWLDVSGCGHLFGGEAALAEDLVRRLAGSGLSARVGLAATPGAAWALARHATTPQHPAAVLAPEADLARALAPLPLTGLRLAPPTLELLRRLGLEQIGQLYDLPPATLAPRFGALLAQRLRQALGRLPEAIGPERPEEPLWVRRAFAEPLSMPEDLARALALLAEELAALLARRGLGARRLELTGHRVDGTQTRMSVGLSRPGRDPRHWLRLFQPKQERLDPGFGIEVVTLAASQAEPLSGEQAALPAAGTAAILPLRPRSPARPAAPAGAAASAPAAVAIAGELPADLAALIDRLVNRLGSETVRRLDPLERHWPEDAVAASAPAAPRPPDRPAWASPRPLYLLRRPEPVEGLALGAGEVPARFTWRRRQLEVATAEGPERITPAWWQPGRAAEPARDYWRVEDREGRRYWLFRSQSAEAAPRWYVHGLFA